MTANLLKFQKKHEVCEAYKVKENTMRDFIVQNALNKTNVLMHKIYSRTQGHRTIVLFIMTRTTSLSLIK